MNTALNPPWSSLQQYSTNRYYLGTLPCGSQIHTTRAGHVSRHLYPSVKFGPVATKCVTGASANCCGTTTVCSYRGMYPPVMKDRPVDSLYGMDLTKHESSGAVSGIRVKHGHRKIYPITDRNVKEMRCWSSNILPFIDQNQGPVQQTFCQRHPNDVFRQCLKK